MKKTLLATPLALLLLGGCVDDSPWRITGSFGVDCTGAVSMIEEAAGGLDIAPASQQQTTFLLQYQMINEIDPPIQMSSNMMPITTVNAANINLKEAIVSYSSTPHFDFKPAKESIALGGVVLPGASTPSALFLNIITQNAADTLLNGVAAGNTAELTVTMQFHGVEQAGGDIYSTTLTFPIHVFNSGVTCTGNDTYGPLGVCGGAGGQDGTRVCCVSDPTCKPPMTTP